jgi:hypothetical protein
MKSYKEFKEGFVHSNHKKLDANYNGKLDADDFKLLRKKKQSTKEDCSMKEDLEEMDLSFIKGAKARGSVADQKAARDALIAKRKETNPNPPALGTSSDKYKLGDYDKKSNRSYSEEVELEEALTASDKKDIEAIKGAIKRLQNELTNPNPNLDRNKINQRIATEKKRLGLYGIKESVEQIDELSKKTLGSYVNKASGKLASHGTNLMGSVGNFNIKNAEYHGSKIDKRQKGISKAVAKLTKESVEDLDEVSIATLDSYRKKSFDEPGFKRQAGRALAFNKLSSHGDSKVKSSEEIDVAKSQIKDLIKPEHHSKYPISKITSMSHGRKIYRDASAAGHLKEEVEEQLEENGDAWDALVAKRKANAATKKPVDHNADLKLNITKAQNSQRVSKILAKEEVELDEMNIGKKQPRPDTHHIVDKENKPLSLAAYYDKAKAEKDRDEKHPGAKVITRGPRGKVKESVELDEKELTDTDVKQKEKVVKGMKKNIQSFKDKYGEKAKGVMYATATKIAQKMPDVKEEVEELEELSKKTLGSYIKKSIVDAAHKTRIAGDPSVKNVPGSGVDKRIDAGEKAVKRERNTEKAINKLTRESIELEEAKKEPMEVYHTGYSAALQHAEKHLNKQGYDIHPDDWQQHISHGPSKPSEGKTVQLHVPLHKDGVKSKKVAHIQVYNRGNTIPKNNELNMYVN